MWEKIILSLPSARRYFNFPRLSITSGMKNNRQNKIFSMQMNRCCSSKYYEDFSFLIEKENHWENWFKTKRKCCHRLLKQNKPVENHIKIPVRECLREERDSKECLRNQSSPCRVSEEGTALNLCDLQALYGEQTGL